jgi:hypothetical protein
LKPVEKGKDKWTYNIATKKRGGCSGLRYKFGHKETFNSQEQQQLIPY